MDSLVSICIPTYNGENYLREALDSVKNQSYRNFEVIISDDKSIDSTLEICEKFKNEVDFPVFIYSHNPQGIGANWNNCVKKSNGEYLKFLFQDDILEEKCLEVMLNKLEETKLKICVCKRNIIYSDSNGETEKWNNIFGDLQKNLNTINNDIITNNIFGDIEFLDPPYNKIGEPIVGLIHKDVYEKIGLYNTDLKQFLDYEFWYRALKEFNFVLVRDSLVSFRFHNLQTTQINKNNNINERGLYFKFVDQNLKSYLHPEVRKRNFPSYLQRIINKINRILK